MTLISKHCADCGIQLNQDNAAETSTSCDYCQTTLRGVPWPGTPTGTPTVDMVAHRQQIVQEIVDWLRDDTKETTWETTALYQYQARDIAEVILERFGTP